MLANNNKKFDLLYILLGGIILCFYAFYNKFPLVYPDTGCYIHSGFENIVPTDRPIFYGLFIRHISLHASLWLVIFVQGIFVSFVIFHCIEFIVTKYNKSCIFFFVIIFLTLFTGISVNVSQLIPDVFTPVSLLCLLILLFGPSRKTTFGFIIFIYILSLLVHFSNIIVHVAVLIVIFVLMVFYKFKKKEFSFKKSKILMISAILFFTICIVPTANYFFEGKFRFSKGTHVFMMNHLLETGILEDYLNNNCSSKNYKICNYKDSLGWNFMWDEKSPLYLTGGWDANKDEYNSIIRDVLSKPKYLKVFAEKSVEYAFIQLFHFDMGDTPACKEDSPPYGQVNWRYNNRVREYVSSLQFNEKLNFSTQNFLQRIIIFLSVFLLIYLYIKQKLSQTHRRILLILIFFFIIHAFVCSTFSGICDRFQSRIIWILPFILILFLSENNYLKFNKEGKP
ncbi:MAG: hypothetical protein V1904_05175 [Bacteroidota bacterium]